eukprot:TRINITY_DN679_c0_g1_i2.p2 TRINITY_DN679_c0_g1~~TRINITY_DN679_c0_g1_i2.p2  ORF type:complete len:224 (-),score=69.78 TRINITY_DN679_c0_g1_i2:667-1338(-)
MMLRSLLRTHGRFMSTIRTSVEEVVMDKISYGKLTREVYKLLKTKADEYHQIEDNIIKLSGKPAELEEYLNATRGRMAELESDSYSFQQFAGTILRIEENKELLNECKDDAEMTKLIQEENEGLLSSCENQRDILLADLLPTQKYDKSNCTVEMKQAVGGKESALFAEWLMNGYSTLAVRMGWSWNVKKLVNDSQGHGVKNSKFVVSGYNAYKYFKHENGVHK